MNMVLFEKYYAFIRKSPAESGMRHAGAIHFHCPLWPANLVQPCWLVILKDNSLEKSFCSHFFIFRGVFGRIDNTDGDIAGFYRITF